MDGRSLTVFAAAAAIGAGFYVFLAPDEKKKKKGTKKGKRWDLGHVCLVFQSAVQRVGSFSDPLQRTHISALFNIISVNIIY